jgi:hypothetical protein
MISLRTSGFLCVVLGLLLASAAQAQIRVAVEDGSGAGSGAGIVAQLNDDTWANFTATKVSAGDIDTLIELENYDVVVLGGSGHDDADWNEAMALALKTWVEAGGGAILTGWGNFDMNGVSAIHSPLDEIFPTQNISSTNDFDNSGALMTILVDHPIFTGLTDFSFPAGCCTEINPLSLESGDLELGRVFAGSPHSGTLVAVKQPGSGLTVYLGPVYMGNESTYSSQFPELRQGFPDRLLEQAVVWAAEGEFTLTSPAPAIPVPTMSEWALIMLFVLLGLMVFANRRRLF